MLNTGISSAISLRTRGSLSFSTHNYSHCSNGIRPFAYSSSKPCCSCCCYSTCTAPLIPNYGCSLYGLRPPSLIQWSPYRRLNSGGFDYYSRLPACDVDGICYCDKICNFREKSVGRRKGVLRKCLEYEERSERYEHGGVDEAEVLLSLLTEDVDEEECFVVRKETQRLVRKPVVGKRESDEVCSKCGSNKKKDDVRVSECESRSQHESIVCSRKNNDRRRKEMIRAKEEREALSREENRKATLREGHKGTSLTNQTEREREEREALLRKASHKAKEEQERSRLRREDWKMRLRTEEKDDSLRREEHRQKVRRDGSSCSSYYSLSSNGDHDSENEIELTGGRSLLDSSSGHKRDSRNNEIVYRDTKEEDQMGEDYREDHGFSLTKKSSSKEFHTGSNVVESDFRKKSEKKLADISVEETELRKDTSLKESKASVAHEINYEKSSDYNVSYDDRKVKSTRSTKHDEERKFELRQTGDELSRRSETMLKYKKNLEGQDTRSGDVRKFSGSQEVYSGKSEMSPKDASSNEETVGEHQAGIGSSTRLDEYEKNSHKVAEVSEIREIDIRKTSISQQRSETSVEREDYSTNIVNYVNDAEKQHQQYDQASGLTESRGKTQPLTRKDNKLILERETDELIKQAENVNLASSSSFESKEPRSPVLAKISKRFDSRSESDELKVNLASSSSFESKEPRSPLLAKISKRFASRNESDELKKVLVTHSGNTGAIRVDDRNKAKSETSERPRPDLPETVMLSPGSRLGITTDEDAIVSTARLEKSSAHYVSEFVEQVRNEMLGSQIQGEKESYETKVLHEETSGVSHSKEHDLGHQNQQSGTKGPSDEMWNVDEQFVQELAEAETQYGANKSGDAIVKRTGRSLWNIIADIVRLRWSSHSESHSSGRKPGGRSSPIQSTSSETWFSGHEAEEHKEATEEKEGRSIRQGLSGSHQEENTGSQLEESPSASTLEGRLRHAGINASSSSVIRESGSPQVSISLPIGGETSGDTSSLAIVDSSIPLPASRLRRSPAVQGVSEAGEAHASDSGISEQVNTGSMEQTETLVNEGEVKRRRLQRRDQVVRDRFDEWEEAYRLEAEQRKIDEMFMREALLEAQKAADNWEVPVGAVLVHNGKIIARGCNLVEELRDSTAHAEILCIREASNMLRTWRLSETTLYVTLEPCPMCAGAILQARIETVVWGAPNKLLGADGSWIRLFPSDGGNDMEQTDKPAPPVHPFHPKMTIRRGVLASECADAMQQFFRRRRKKDKKAENPSTPPSCLPVSHRPKFLAKMHDAFNLMFCL